MITPFTIDRALGAWQFAPVVTVALGSAALGYLLGVWRIGRREYAHHWPGYRTSAFFAGLAVVAIATQSSIGVYDDVLFSVHMVQHLLLIMVAPPLFVIGRPATLLLHAFGNPVHSRIKQVLRSRPLTLATWPPVAAAMYAVVVVGTHLTPFMNLVLENDAIHDAEHALYLVVGYLFFLPLIGSEPIRWRLSMASRFLLVMVTMPVDTFVGVALMIAPHELFSAYAAEPRPWGPSLVSDLNTGGAIMWIGSDIIMIPIALAVAVGFVNDPRRKGQLGGRFERIRTTGFLNELSRSGISAPAGGLVKGIDDDAHLAAYNAYLQNRSPD